MTEILEQFGITWPGILYVLGNTVVLVAGLYFLLFKPVKKMMADRKAKAEEVFNENKRLNQEVVDTRLKYDAMTKDAAEKITVMMNESAKAAQDKADEIVAAAKQKAQELIMTAKQQIEGERVRMEQYFRTEMTSLAVDIAAKVLEREVRPEDNLRLIDDAISEWTN